MHIIYIYIYIQSVSCICPMMSSSRNCRIRTEFLAVSLIFLLSFSSSISDAFTVGLKKFSSSPSGSGSGSSMVYSAEENGRKTVLGSKPPRCINKCMNCNPCEATLVIPHHQNKNKAFRESARREDDSYYLLSWKCKCGNKLFQP